jgi:hypothetical protein
LLFYILRRLVQEHIRFYQYRHKGAMPTAVRIPIEELARKAREVNITDVQPFLNLPAFTANGFQWDATAGVVVKAL